MTFSDGRTISHEVLEHYRLRAIALHEKGEPVNQIAEYFGIHRGSVSRWITTCNRQGKTALKSKKAPGPSTKIPGEDVPAVLAMLENDATQYGFETPLWTCQRLRIMLKRNWNVSLHSTNVMRLLNRWKITPQKMACDSVFSGRSGRFADARHGKNMGATRQNAGRESDWKTRRRHGYFRYQSGRTYGFPAGKSTSERVKTYRVFGTVIAESSTSKNYRD